MLELEPAHPWPTDAAPAPRGIQWLHDAFTEWRDAALTWLASMRRWSSTRQLTSAGLPDRYAQRDKGEADGWAWPKLHSSPTSAVRPYRYFGRLPLLVVVQHPRQVLGRAKQLACRQARLALRAPTGVMAPFGLVATRPFACFLFSQWLRPGSLGTCSRRSRAPSKGMAEAHLTSYEYVDRSQSRTEGGGRAGTCTGQQQQSCHCDCSHYSYLVLLVQRRVSRRLSSMASGWRASKSSTSQRTHPLLRVVLLDLECQARPQSVACILVGFPTRACGYRLLGRPFSKLSTYLDKYYYDLPQPRSTYFGHVCASISPVRQVPPNQQLDAHRYLPRYEHGSPFLSANAGARLSGVLHRQRPGLEDRVCPIGWDSHARLAFPESHSSKEEHNPLSQLPDGVGLGVHFRLGREHGQ
ncbi:hypothetical protein J3F83DRAFT_559207 [Trichoderma novae-zelandiae]